MPSARGPHAHLRLRVRQVRRRVRAVPVVLRGPAEEAPRRLRRQGRQGAPARRHRAEGLGLLQERQPQPAKRQLQRVARRARSRSDSSESSESTSDKSDSKSESSSTSSNESTARSRTRRSRRLVAKKSSSALDVRQPAPPLLSPAPLPRRTSPVLPRRPTRRGPSSGKDSAMLRRSPRALALWGAALVVAVVTAAVVAVDLAALHRRAADLGPERDAVVATRDLAVGDRARARTTSRCAGAPRRSSRTVSSRDRDDARAARRGGAGAPRRLRRRPQPRAAPSHRARRRRARGHAGDPGRRSPTRCARARARRSTCSRATTRGAPTATSAARRPSSSPPASLVLGTDRRASGGTGRAGRAGVDAARRPRRSRRARRRTGERCRHPRAGAARGSGVDVSVPSWRP